MTSLRIYFSDILITQYFIFNFLSISFIFITNKSFSDLKFEKGGKK